MLESLIRMTEAHARLLMKSKATIYDAVCVVVLMEHTLMTELFANDGEDLPSVVLNSIEDYIKIKNELMYKLGIDPSSFSEMR
jgi:DNA replicative helicase MCM subunit Mcm2 (Cdc46/Mcm family)